VIIASRWYRGLRSCYPAQVADDERKQLPPTLPAFPPGGTLRLDASQILQAAAGREQGQRGSLLVIGGIHADIGTHLVVETAVTIGREQVGLQLHDGGISRLHAAVERRDVLYVIRDLGSTNGTLVNGERLAAERVLVEGDKIFLGQTMIKFTMVDETEAAYLRQVATLVGTDDLTGLMSTHRFDAAMKEAVRTAIAAGAPLCALMLDMDGLKAVNDRHGHHAGADTIRRVGALIGQLLQGRGEACRFGGDEFSAFLPGVALAAAVGVGEQIRRAVEAMAPVWGGERLAVTISVGVASLRPGVSDAAALLRLADQALYRAKGGGKNRVSD
jgi:diguanylate cyclase (GGDEF)-like protein